jgi:hypothetical protein
MELNEVVDVDFIEFVELIICCSEKVQKNHRRPQKRKRSNDLKLERGETLL